MNHPSGGGVPFVSKLSSVEKHIDNKGAQSSVAFIYQAKIAELLRNVTATWSKNLINHSFSITVENMKDDQNHYTCKIDLKAWQFWGKKGLKNLEVDGRRVDVFWDFRQAKFSSSPDPCSDYYVALVCEEEVVLLLGDLKNDALKRTRKKPSPAEATLLYKKEHVYGKKLFYTRAVLDESQKEHDVVIESSLSGPDDPEMWITVDGTMEIRIMNLNWRFRGNETITVNDVPVQILWDVHDWLFNSSGSSHGLFVFQPGPLDSEPNKHKNYSNNNTINEKKSKDLSQSALECYHILYAWKIE
ncbi:uncharacterized protein LOC110820709 [Carica papaya]|uniref:uncharacterized protein LOC110820709 n=1 Tax=Carica papaya TaxID=3649 RepID=UPI000B8C6F62|nr:uncharacterized protein LOC110820709 [Carica papaya]